MSSGGSWHFWGKKDEWFSIPQQTWFNQWEFQDPKMEVLYHILGHFAGDIPKNIKNRPKIDGIGTSKFHRILKISHWFKESLLETPWSQRCWDLGASEFSLITCWMVALTRLMQLPGLEIQLPKSWALLGNGWWFNGGLMGFNEGLWWFNGGLMGFNEGLWWFNGGLMGFNEGLWWFNGGLMGFNEGLWWFNGGLMGFNEGLWWFHGT